MNRSMILKMTGIIWSGLSVLLIAYCLIAILLDPSHFRNILFELGCGFALLLMCYFLIKHHDGDVRHLSKREAIVIVLLAWVGMVCVGTLPYLLHDEVELSITEAIFESASGFSTTGASIFTNVESLPKSILFWRSLTQWFGGMGIIVLFVSIMPALGFSGKNLFQNEMPGPVKENLTPHIRDTSRYLWTIYCGLTLLVFFLFWIEGLEGFDALCHALTTISTGGFSTKNASACRI